MTTKINKVKYYLSRYLKYFLIKYSYLLRKQTLVSIVAKAIIAVI